MPSIWKNTDYTVPPSGTMLLAKYNPLRSDFPYRYIVVKHSDGKWNTIVFEEGGYMTEITIPKPDWWALIEPEDDHA